MAGFHLPMAGWFCLPTDMSSAFQVSGNNPAALFTLKLHRGDGMTLIAMNWKDGPPPEDFVGFAIEYKEPDGSKFLELRSRLDWFTHAGTSTVTRTQQSSYHGSRLDPYAFRVVTPG